MLPSTGYFKTINCPYYEAGSCERPYCHFKHARREDVGASGGAAATTTTVAATPTTGSGAAGTAATEVRTQVQQEPGGQGRNASDSDVLQRLVTEAVKKVLADRDSSDKFPDDVVSQVVEGLKPSLGQAPGQPLVQEPVQEMMTVSKPVPCVYNPTPIAELRKRHIPIVSYMPTRESRVSAKRKSSPDRAKPWLMGHETSLESRTQEVRYKPTAITNTTVERSTESVQSYVPTIKSDSSSSNSYEDGNSNDYMKLGDAYYPRSKKRREEYVPKKVKAPLKLPEATTGTTEYDIMDEIFTAGHPVVRVPPSDDSRDSCYDIEPKFSDDEPNSKDAADATVPEKGQVEEDLVRTEQSNKETDDRVTEERSRKEEQRLDEVKEKTERSKGGKEETERSKGGKEEKRSSSRRNSEDTRKPRSSERTSKKESRSHSTSGRTTSKERNRHESRTTEKKQRSRSRDKEKERKEGKKESRKDKKDSSRKGKDSRRESEKSRDSKTTSSSRKKRSRDKSRDRHRSRSSSHKSGRESSSRKSTTRIEHEEDERNLSDGSAVNATNFRNAVEMGLEDDDDDDEELIGELLEDEVLSISDSDHDVQEECLKIFQEYQVTEQPKPVNPKEPPKREEETNEDLGSKKRIAHPSAAMNVTRHSVAPAQPTKKASNPQQKMYERWRLMREAAAERAAEKAKNNPAPTPAVPVVSEPKPRPVPVVSEPKPRPVPEPEAAPRTNDLQLNGNGRIRIAHVPYARSLAKEKRKVAENAVPSSEGKPDSRTAAQTAKCGVRVAHIPQAVPQLIRPEPLPVTTQKFPLNVRQYYVNAMHDICVQIYTNAEDAAERAVKEEFACHERCKALPVYKNSCMLAAHRLRKEVEQQTANLEGGTSGASGSGIVSHEAVLAGKSKGSWSVLRTKRSVTDFKGPVLYGMLKKWIMTEQQLRDNGFPRPHPDGHKGHAKVYVVNTRNQTILSKVPNERICLRCGQGYMVDKHGFAVQQQNCIYHWGRKFTMRGESKYSCCQQYGSAGGCCDAKTHVWDYTDYENLRGYVKTLPKETPDQGVYALDCEMCYTTQGLELTRVTVVDQECNVVYESLVRPQNPIIDYNTRFSGITEGHMDGVTTSLLDVQATLLTMFSDRTVLVGHSLESDFKALRLLHDTVVDTSVVFPHKNGLPQKRALKNLCSEYLRKIIQNDVGGHDSKEDAVACMELILWKAKEEAKLQ